MDHLNFRIQLIKEVLEKHGSSVETRPIGRPSKTPMSEQITAHHFIEMIPSKIEEGQTIQKVHWVLQKDRKQQTAVRNVELGFV